MSLRIWLPLNGNINNQGLSNAVITALSTPTYSNNGKIGQCAYGAYKINYKQTNNEISVAFWICLTGSSQWADIFSFGTGLNRIENISASGSTSCMQHWYSTSDSAFITGQDLFTLTVGKWTHVIMTADGQNVKFYIDGQLVKTTAQTSTVSTGLFNRDYFYIGCRDGDASYPYLANLNDFRLYDHCLSQKEVKELAKGLVLHYRLAGPGQENLVTSLSAGGQTSVDGTYAVHTSRTNADTYFYANLSSSLNPGDKVTVSCDVSGFASNDYQWNFPFWSKGSGLEFWLKNGHCSKTFTVPSGVSASNRIIFDDIGVINGFTRGDSIIYIKNFKIERGGVQTPWCPNPADLLYSTLGYNNNIEYDCSGYCRNGTKSGTITWDVDSPRYTTSYKFNGSSCIKNNQFYFDSPIWTVSLWYKYNTAPTAYEGFICLSKSDGSDSNKKFAIMPNSNYIWFKAENSSATISSLKVGEWCHLAIVSNGTSATIYENGVQRATTTISSSITGAYDLVVGARASSAGAATTSVYNKGNISDVRIYTTALSADDIAELYHSAVIVDSTGKNYAYEYFEAN